MTRPHRILALAVLAVAAACVVVEARAQQYSASQWRGQTQLAAEEAGLDWRILEAVIAIESGGNPRAVSSAGAIGLGQLLPDTARRLGVDPWLPLDNLRGSARWLVLMRQEVGGSLPMTLAAYHCNPTCARSGRWPASTVAYVNAVMTEYDRLARTASAAPASPPRLPVGLPRAGEGGLSG